MHKRVPGEPETIIKEKNTTMNKIIIIIFALLGAFFTRNWNGFKNVFINDSWFYHDYHWFIFRLIKVD